MFKKSIFTYLDNNSICKLCRWYISDKMNYRFSSTLPPADVKSVHLCLFMFVTLSTITVKWNHAVTSRCVIHSICLLCVWSWPCLWYDSTIIMTNEVWFNSPISWTMILLEQGHACLLPYTDAVRRKSVAMQLFTKHTGHWAKVISLPKYWYWANPRLP